MFPFNQWKLKILLKYYKKPLPFWQGFFYFMTFLALIVPCHNKLNFSFLSLGLSKLKRKNYVGL